MTPRVHVVVVNWNGGEMVLEALESAKASQEVEVVLHVVDNGSTDGSADAIEGRFPAARVHRTGRNLGFAAGANVGLRACLEEDAAWAFLLNNDATLDPDALGELVRAAGEHPEAGLLAGRIYLDRAADRLWCCGVTLGFWPNLCRLRGNGRSGRGRYEQPEWVHSFTGCGLLIGRAVLDEVGLLDEDYFVYVEDADYCVRAQKRGFRCRYVPSAVMEHGASQSTGGGYAAARKYLTGYGSVLFLKRHGRVHWWAGFLVFDVLLYPLLLLSASVRGRLRGALGKGRGMWHGLVGRPVDRGIVGGPPA